MPKIADRVAETTATTGTVAFNLLGEKPGYRAFDTAFLVGDSVYYCVAGANEWEVGIGVLGAGTLSRLTILSSSSGGAAVSFSVGTKDVICVAPAALLDSLAPLASPTFTGTVAGITKTMVGLGSVDNTADTAKPVSTAQTTAFAVLGPYADATALESAKPAASNGGRVALVGASAPYSAYVSNGTAWVLFDNNSDPLVTVASSGSSVSQAATNLSVLNITLTANTTLGFTSIPAGTWSITLILRQDGTGSRLVTWPANTKWAAATAPTLSTAASAVDVVTLMTIDAGTTWFGFLGGKGMA